MIKAVVFDLDGTLYPEAARNKLMFFEFLTNVKFFLAFKQIRKKIRILQSNQFSSSNRDELFSLQVKMLSEHLNLDENRCSFLLNKIYYSQIFSDKFKKLKPYHGVQDLIYWLKFKGIKLGIMSDFPILGRVKNLLGIQDSFWDILCSSEDTGYLKPHKAPFLKVIEDLNLSGNNILYVGNSYEYDILGARNVSMKAAFFSKRNINYKGMIDFIFHDYKDLREYIRLNI
ncbi:haloacid dehalogenase [Borreliella bissettiae]|uniref:Haloacid dehalogenase n=1 Tax=Borrelia bissettiae TaxID=64897 RepID=A0A1L8ZBV5_BORBI|nr:HAD family hydrolase [Borreliella bissettiae]OJH15206.1 haloacid dehalogenase [Borreliella bissettiae]